MKLLSLELGMLRVCSAAADPKLNELTKYLLGIFDERVVLKKKKVKRGRRHGENLHVCISVGVYEGE